MFRYLKPCELICLKYVVFQKTKTLWFLTFIHLVPEACCPCRRLFSTLDMVKQAVHTVPTLCTCFVIFISAENLVILTVIYKITRILSINKICATLSSKFVNTDKIFRILTLPTGKIWQILTQNIVISNPTVYRKYFVGRVIMVLQSMVHELSDLF